MAVPASVDLVRADQAGQAGQQPPGGPGTPTPSVGWSTTPTAELRSTAPKWTTYHRPRQEISDAIPMDRS